MQKKFVRGWRMGFIVAFSSFRFSPKFLRGMRALCTYLYLNITKSDHKSKMPNATPAVSRVHAEKPCTVNDPRLS